eukprot:COSAG03_NODE_1785_length_3524_cov_2.658302_1_plen_257_part_10
MARNQVMPRDDMISTFKPRGQKGALSKMTKPQLKVLLQRTAPPGAPSHDEKPRSDIALEPDERQVGGHYYRKNGETKSDGSHEHKSDPWPVSEASKAKRAPAQKARKRKLDPVEDPDAEITVALVNKRLNADRHPGGDHDDGGGGDGPDKIGIDNGHKAYGHKHSMEAAPTAAEPGGLLRSSDGCAGAGAAASGRAPRGTDARRRDRELGRRPGAPTAARSSPLRARPGINVGRRKIEAMQESLARACAAALAIAS